MNEMIVTNWNSVVKPNDIVIVAGDVSFNRDPIAVEKFVRRLNGHKTLVLGNHDQVFRGGKLLGFENKVHYLEDDIYDNVAKIDRKLCIFHYPIFSWNKKHHGAWLAYGHCHGSMIKDMDAMFPGTWDVGVDTNNYTPISYEELAVKIRTTYKGQDAEDKRHKY